MFLTVFFFVHILICPLLKGIQIRICPWIKDSISTGNLQMDVSGGGVVNGFLFSQTGDQMADPQRMCRRVVIKFVADGIDNIKLQGRS